jgi:hypothetical protein
MAPPKDMIRFYHGSLPAGNGDKTSLDFATTAGTVSYFHNMKCPLDAPIEDNCFQTGETDRMRRGSKKTCT